MEFFDIPLISSQHDGELHPNIKLLELIYSLHCLGRRLRDGFDGICAGLREKVEDTGARYGGNGEVVGDVGISLHIYRYHIL